MKTDTREEIVHYGSLDYTERSAEVALEKCYDL